MNTDSQCTEEPANGGQSEFEISCDEEEEW